MKVKEIFKQFPQIEAEKLILREVKEGDKKEIFNIFSDSEIMKYYDLIPFKSIEEAEHLISKFNDDFAKENGIRWGITKKDSDKIIGTCGFHSWSKESFKAQIGYELLKEYWRQGIMAESLKAIILFGFESLNLNRIEALVELENVSSQKLLCNLGFQKEGVLRENEFCRGKFLDLIMFSLLKNDFTK
ncbi:GNAT family N-acetyltransferase [Clostridium sp. ZS2-4]|uniref:GNAT family N-acetyltransferase n=1 Tax=Clostridium sp. ZS2-4 TaxID=2987703 RepID=UPI00227D6121|nr:GNAT family protein [Clostridium sp. ZS2-4]MCY6354889.1 GNAT family protein [Clostridium sp. ZS2-4]